MRKLILQVQVSLNQYMSNKNGEGDWLIWPWSERWTWDKELQEYFNALHASVDCVLLSRKMAEEGFIGHWADMARKKDNPQSSFAGAITAARKVVFSKTLTRSKWENTVIAGGNLAEEVGALKQQKGGDMIAYGGAGFASSLIREGLVDEYQLFINPVLLRGGLPLFPADMEDQSLRLVDSRPYTCGVSVLTYTKE